MMANAQTMKRKPQAVDKAAKPGTEKPVARAADNKAPGYLQAKMKVSQPGDAHEQQADQVAERVSRAAKPDTPVTGADKAVQRATLQPGEDLGDQQQTLSRKPDQAKPESTLSKKPQDNLAKKADRQSLQAKGDVPQIDQATEERINSLRGKGESLPEVVKNEMQQQLQADFSAVRIHNSGEAAALAAGINAKAFTVGNDIFFATGEYAPDSAEGRKLLAHELTHVVQQSDGIASKIMRASGSTPAATPNPTPAPSAPANPNLYDGPEGRFEKTSTPYRLGLKGVHLPRVKQTFTPIPVRVRPSGEQRSGRQAQTWDTAARDGAGLNASLDSKITQAWQFGEPGSPVYYFRIGRAAGRDRQNYLVGDRTSIRNRVLRPYWTPGGQISTFDVDHKQEYQLNGPDLEMSNLWLLESSTNRSSGALIDQEIERRVNLLVSKTSDVMWTGANRPDYATLRANHSIEITNAAFDKPTAGSGRNYTLEQVKDEAIQMGPVLPMNHRQVQQAGLEPNPSRFIIFNNSTGGRSFTANLPPTGESAAIPFTDQTFIPGFRPTTMSLTPDQAVVARIQGSLFSANRGLYGHGINVEVQVSRMEGMPQAGFVNFSALRQNVIDLFGTENIQLQGMSPLQVQDVAMDDLGGVTVTARVMTDIELIRNADLRVVITGTDVSLQKTFSGSELSLPGPVRITGSSLTVALSVARGLAVEGQANLAIDRVGTGFIGAEASTGTGRGAEFAVAGRFNFDPELFDAPSYVAIAYRNNTFSGEGQLTIGQGRIRGVRSGSLGVTFNGADFTITGSVAPEIPGVEQATVSVRQTEAEGLIYEGDLQLSANPAIRSGSIHARLQKQDEAWRVSASGRAQPAIPGIDSELTVSYENGAFTAEFSGAFQRGMLAGNATVGVTNRAVGEDGRASGEPLPDGALNVYGNGSATLQIAPWLQGTVGITFAPNGEVTVVGEIGLPSAVELLPRKQVERNLFSVGTSIPIVPGIVARIAGGADAVAGFGPGQLDQMNLRVEYNPSHEENTHISGGAHLNVPADAGVRLFVRAGIGLGIPGASATGGLEIGGQLGIAGAAEAAVNFDWTPTTGLEINAEGYIHAQPRFVFDISGYVEVEALWITVYEQRWNFASFEYGSDLTFGVRFPIHYQEGQPFDIALSDVQFETPNIDTDAILSGLIDRIA
jgi:Domain of unknown function (DUF4157)